MKTLLTAIGLLLVAPAWAHGDAMHSEGAKAVVMEQKPWGIAAKPTSVARTIEVSMDDRMRFTPNVINVNQGERVRLRIHNSGQALHEFVLGSHDELMDHAQMMKRFPDMEHDEPYMAHVPPGRTVDILWTFNRSGRFEFACLLPGHYDAGMKGSVEVHKKDRKAQ